tara:strand:+ start:155 stop:367 length:213 start_codon:yes stop_codon:yes gene_type:complete
MLEWIEAILIVLPYFILFMCYIVWDNNKMKREALELEQGISRLSEAYDNSQTALSEICTALEELNRELDN